MLKYSKEKQIGQQAIEYGDKVDDVQENILQQQCEELLDWYKIKFWRMPDSLETYIMTRTPIQYKKIFSKYFLGKPDLTILLPSGKYLNVELKTENGKLTGGQKRFAKQQETYVVRSFDDFDKLLNEKLKDE